VGRGLESSPHTVPGALVADPASEAMTCGYAVNEAMDNSAHAWITTVILWVAEKISVASPGHLRHAGLKE
jgi:hypothetical protein